MVTVNLTNQCNQNCIYCEIGREHPLPGKDALSFSDLVWIIDEMAVNKIKKISLCGGEPFLFKGIIDVVAHAGRKNILCSITTNGMTAHLLSNSDLKVLKDCRTEVNVSVDSFDEDVESNTRGTTSALPNSLKSIKKLSGKGIPVTVLTVITKFNYRDLSGFFMNAYKKDIRQVLFQPVISFSNYPERKAVENKSQLNVNTDQLPVLMEELRKILIFERRHKISSNVYRILPWIVAYLEQADKQEGKWFFENALGKFYCREIFAIIDISYDGGIQPCALTKASVSIHSDRQQGLLGLWIKATEGIREDIMNGRFYDYCNGCCNHFSRNMLSSIIKFPLKNRVALFKMMPLILSRLQWQILKKFNIFI
jgi:MoaA/NifB/PqqE/SkfB family radical SAM enzyme